MRSSPHRITNIGAGCHGAEIRSPSSPPQNNGRERQMFFALEEISDARGKHEHRLSQLGAVRPVKPNSQRSRQRRHRDRKRDGQMRPSAMVSQQDRGVSQR
jgi:hypothetical protein